MTCGIPGIEIRRGSQPVDDPLSEQRGVPLRVGFGGCKSGLPTEPLSSGRLRGIASGELSQY
jgi:hypothetical protein